MRNVVVGLAGVWWLLSGVAGAPTGWTDFLSVQSPAAWTASGPAVVRRTAGTVEVRAEDGGGTVAVARLGRGEYDLELEVLWRPRDSRRAGGLDMALGPHAFGSSGYRVVVSRRGWEAAECRAPRLEPGVWHAIGLRVRRERLAYWLDGRPVVGCRAARAEADALRLVVGAGSEVVVRRCRLRGYEASEAGDTVAAAERFVYPAAAFGHEGRVVADARAAGGRGVEGAGAGERRSLVWGQDGALGRSGRYVAIFGVRSMAGWGDVWLTVARSGGATVATGRARLEELPTGGYGRVRVPFRCEAGWLLEYRVAAAGGRLRVDQVVVVGGEDAERAVGEAPVDPRARGARRERRARALSEVWGKAPEPGTADAPVRLVRLRRRLVAGGWYEFTAQWRQEASGPLANVAVDLWVACRDKWGIVRTYDYGAAHGSVAPGLRETAGSLSPGDIERSGPPVAFMAQVYKDGLPVGAAWRKWGIPVDDKYIVTAERVGELGAVSPATE